MAYARRVMAHAQRLMTARRPLLLLIGGGSTLTAAALTARHYDAPPLPQLQRLRLEAPTSTPADNAKPSFSRWSPLRKGPLVDDATVVSTSTSAAHATPSSCSPQCPGRIADVAADVLESVAAVRVETDIFIKTGMFKQRREERVLASTGSAFCVHESGLFVTNAHVVSDVSTDATAKMTLTTSDGHTYKAVLHAMDPWSDFAVVRVVTALDQPSSAVAADTASNDAKPNSQTALRQPHWKPVRFGRSEDLSLGEWVFTYGHPMGLTYSLTAGIVSSLHRKNVDVDMSGKMDSRIEYIQTNFAGFDQGNSGGAVFNLKYADVECAASGEVVAVNVIKADHDGLNFSIRIDCADNIIADLVNNGRVVRPWLGVRMVTLSHDVAGQIYSAYSTDSNEVAVSGENSASTPPATPSLLDQIVQWVTEGSKIVTGATDDDTPPSVATPPAKDPVLQTLEAGAENGLLVTSVFAPSPASRAGIEVGDVIIKIHDEETTSAKQLFDLLSHEIDEEVPLTVLRYSSTKQKLKPHRCTIVPELLDVFDQTSAPLNIGDHEAVYASYLRSLDVERRAKLRFLEK